MKSKVMRNTRNSICSSRSVFFCSLLEPFLSEFDQYFGICDRVKFLVGISTSNLAWVLIG